MSTQFMFYIKFNTFAEKLRSESGRKNEYLASDQLERMMPGDTLYIVTQQPGTSGLYFISRLAVAKILPQREAAVYLGERPENLWQASLYAIADKAAAEPFKLIDISNCAGALRFISPTGRDHLEIENGVFRAQQLQQARRLEPASAALLDDIWCTGRDELSSLLQTF